jgi:hypothetical protein
MSLSIILSISFGTCLVISIICGFSLYYAGYVPRIQWNENLVMTTCRIVNHTITMNRCNYDCNCYQDCANKKTSFMDASKTVTTSGCVNKCSVCSRDCWSGSFTHH